MTYRQVKKIFLTN